VGPIWIDLMLPSLIRRLAVCLLIDNVWQTTLTGTASGSPSVAVMIRLYRMAQSADTFDPLWRMLCRCQS